MSDTSKCEIIIYFKCNEKWCKFNGTLRYNFNDSTFKFTHNGYCRHLLMNNNDSLLNELKSTEIGKDKELIPEIEKKRPTMIYHKVKIIYIINININIH